MSTLEGTQNPGDEKPHTLGVRNREAGVKIGYGRVPDLATPQHPPCQQYPVLRTKKSPLEVVEEARICLICGTDISQTNFLNLEYVNSSSEKQYVKSCVRSLRQLFPAVKTNHDLKAILQPQCFCTNCVETLCSAKFAFDQISKLKSQLTITRKKILDDLKLNAENINQNKRENSSLAKILKTLSEGFQASKDPIDQMCGPSVSEMGESTTAAEMEIKVEPDVEAYITSPDYHHKPKPQTPKKKPSPPKRKLITSVNKNSSFGSKTTKPTATAKKGTNFSLGPSRMDTDLPDPEHSASEFVDAVIQRTLKSVFFEPSPDPSAQKDTNNVLTKSKPRYVVKAVPIPESKKTISCFFNQQNPDSSKLCPQKFSAEEAMMIHFRKDHEGDTKPYWCSKCPAKYSGPIALEEHNGKRHEGPVYKCSTCGFVLYNRFTYADHMNSHVAPEVPKKSDHRLLATNYTTQTIAYNEEYLKVVSPKGDTFKIKKPPGVAAIPIKPKSRPYECTLCTARPFANKDELKYHMDTTHFVKYPFQCSECFHNFRTKQVLQKHFSAYHVSYFKCQQCDPHGKVYDINGLIEHYNEIHSLNIRKIRDPSANNIDLDISKVECGHCDRKFSKKTLLNIHMKVFHRGSIVGHFACSYCNKGFSNKTSRQRHERSHREKKKIGPVITNLKIGPSQPNSNIIDIPQLNDPTSTLGMLNVPFSDDMSTSSIEFRKSVGW